MIIALSRLNYMKLHDNIFVDVYIKLQNTAFVIDFVIYINYEAIVVVLDNGFQVLHKALHADAGLSKFVFARTI